MDYFRYRDNQLYCEDVPVEAIARQVGTPLYLYSAATLRSHYDNLTKAFAELSPLICYSIKSCSNINICRLLAEWGSGFDVVSGGELYRAMQAGGSAEKVVYAGVGKTDDELRMAIKAGIAYFNVESEDELANLCSIAGGMSKEVCAALRINPDVDPVTHRYITTGKKETKFGVDMERALMVFEKFGRHAHVKLKGIHIHIGSGGSTVEPYAEAIEKTLGLIDELRSRGFEIEAINLGGGFGADYTTGQSPSAADYASVIVPLLRGKGLRLLMEPGRTISGNAGILLTRVIYTKRGGEKNFTIVDAGMNDLIRPPLYQAFHFIWPVQVAEGFSIENRDDPLELPGTEKTDIVGPICESSDFMAKDRFLPPLTRGNLLSIFTAGAYGFAMSSQYNSRPRAAEVLVDGSEFRVIRRRETYEDLIALEKE